MTNSKKTMTTAALGMIAGVAITMTLAFCAPDDAAPTPPPAAPTEVVPAPTNTYTLTDCAQEDSNNCFWDAALRGNGEGTSFITLNGTTYYPAN